MAELHRRLLPALGIDGFDVCRSIRRNSDVPIVMVTARADTHDVVAGLEAGADDYLVKPVRRAELLARFCVGCGVLECGTGQTGAQACHTRATKIQGLQCNWDANFV